MSYETKVTQVTKTVTIYTCDTCGKVAKTTRCNGCGKDACRDCRVIWAIDKFTGEFNPLNPTYCIGCDRLAEPLAEVSRLAAEKAEEVYEEQLTKWYQAIGKVQ